MGSRALLGELVPFLCSWGCHFCGNTTWAGISVPAWRALALWALGRLPFIPCQHFTRVYIKSALGPRPLTTHTFIIYFIWQASPVTAPALSVMYAALGPRGRGWPASLSASLRLTVTSANKSWLAYGNQLNGRGRLTRLTIVSFMEIEECSLVSMEVMK